MDCCVLLAALIGRSPRTLALPLNPLPLWAAARIVSPPRALPVPAWPPLPFPWYRLCQRSPRTVPGGGWGEVR